MLPFVRTVSVANYKSLARCRVDLARMTLLVGPNGSGKSNFLDALEFVSDALDTTVEQALRDRGGIASVRRRSRGHPTHFGIRLDLTLPDGRPGQYSFRIGAAPQGGFFVQREECRIGPKERLSAEISFAADAQVADAFFLVEDGSVVRSSRELPTVLERDRLALVAISGYTEFRPVFDGLRSMGFYNLNLDRIRSLQDPDPGQLLAGDGGNLAAVIRELGRFDDGRILTKISEHLQAVVPGIVSVEHVALGPKETIQFRQNVAGDENPWKFSASEMSDGTLRALAILVAAFQANRNGTRRVSLVGVEEPEIALHPGAAHVIASALLIASEKVQVIATTHSPDLLNHKAIQDHNLLAVSASEGSTQIGPIEPGARSAIRDRLYGAGELLSQGSLEPDLGAVAETSRQLRLFSDQAE